MDEPPEWEVRVVFAGRLRADDVAQAIRTIHARILHLGIVKMTTEVRQVSKDQ